MSKKIEKYCKHPKFTLFTEIKPNIQQFLYKLAVYCEEKDMGDKDIVNMIIRHYQMTKITNEQLRGIESLNMALGIIKKIHDNKGFPRIVVYDTDNIPIYKFSYNSPRGLPNMFLIEETSKKN